MVQEVQQQEQINAALIRRRNSFDMSVATQPRLQKDYTIVPGLLLAKDEHIARTLDEVLQHQHGDLPRLEPKGVPFFDHMAFFYQEGADFEPNTLVDREFFENAYQQKLQQRSDNLDPLRSMKVNEAAPSGAPASGAQA